MQVSIPLLDGELSLRIADQAAGENGYPTRRLQKGLLLFRDGQDLAEEGVGFGVPVLKQGIRTIFPGGVRLDWRREGALWQVTAAFDMNLVERLAKPGGAPLRSKPLYAAKNRLAALHRRAPVLRGPLTATSNAVRRAFGWVTTFEEAESRATVKVTYSVGGERGGIAVAVDLGGVSWDDVTEAVVMNEQGARTFDRYVDADGTSLQSTEIGPWDQVVAEKATFVSSAHRVAFSLGQVDGATLHRGRELIGSRLAWSGFGYSFPAPVASFGYNVDIERIS